MRIRWLAVLALVAAIGLFTPTVSADEGRGRGDHADRHDHHDRDHDRDDDRWERHDRYDVRIYEVREGPPPGWRHGKKTGWGNCGLPPGQAKKYGCRTYVYEERRYYYYHDDAGRIILRRPHIDIHAVIH